MITFNYDKLKLKYGELIFRDVALAAKKYKVKTLHQRIMRAFANNAVILEVHERYF